MERWREENGEKFLVSKQEYLLHKSRLLCVPIGLIYHLGPTSFYGINGNPGVFSIAPFFKYILLFNFLYNFDAELKSVYL